MQSIIFSTKNYINGLLIGKRQENPSQKRDGFSCPVLKAVDDMGVR